ncbi:iron donor protein CyaY [Lichtheimia ornata]|uniref:ferroxidase n=1 Tax=Lichtheimia ornata TaxID=688661 RepID=A0AAD7V062_9FUNG|nr:iron donor protein CyaY [Lichtheimia ornata]KAJ8656712.1 iron donor protein CyaY [Lichtheimia ornata]
MSLARHLARPFCRHLALIARRSAVAAPNAMVKTNTMRTAVVPGNRSWVMSQHCYSTGVTYTATPMNIDTYHDVSDTTLDHLDEYLENLGDELDLDGFDVEYAQGVMTIKLGAHGTYVINKQPPNQQIWLSSPKSGPKRYDWDGEKKKWFYQRDNHTLDELLNTELSEVFDKSIDVFEGLEI